MKVEGTRMGILLGHIKAISPTNPSGVANRLRIGNKELIFSNSHDKQISTPKLLALNVLHLSLHLRLQNRIIPTCDPPVRCLEKNEMN